LNTMHHGVLMRDSLYISSYHDGSARRAKHASHLGLEVAWAERLPALWRSLTISPLWVEVHRDELSGAERWVGHDEEEHPCFCKHSFKLDIGALGGPSGYAEDLVAWRMRDGRWLIHRIIMSHAEGRTSYAFYAFADRMPR
jgi:hypothetical protein